MGFACEGDAQPDVRGGDLRAGDARVGGVSFGVCGGNTTDTFLLAYVGELHTSAVSNSFGCVTSFPDRVRVWAS